MPEMINCEQCQCPIELLKATHYESRAGQDGKAEEHFVCGSACLTTAFNKQFQSNDQKTVLNTAS